MLFICYLKEETALKCPFCNYNDTKVIDSRGQEDNSVIRRRRLCESCGKRFTTYERIDMIPITVIRNFRQNQDYQRCNEILQQASRYGTADSGAGG